MRALFAFLGRMAAAFAGAAALPALAERPAFEADDGTAFVRDAGNEIFRLMNDRGSSAAAREAGLRAVYRARFAGDVLAARVAGSAWRGAPAAGRAHFAGLLERYFVASLTKRLSEIAGARLDVTMSEPEGGGLVIYSRVVGREPGREVNVRWRLAKHGADFRIHDVLIENISVSLHLRRVLRERRESRDDALGALAARLESLVAADEPSQSGAAR